MKADLSRSGWKDYFVNKIMNISRPETRGEQNPITLEKKFQIHTKKNSLLVLGSGINIC
jgi:hypothetical protein